MAGPKQCNVFHNVCHIGRRSRSVVAQGVAGHPVCSLPHVPARLPPAVAPDLTRGPHSVAHHARAGSSEVPPPETRPFRRTGRPAGRPPGPFACPPGRPFAREAARPARPCDRPCVRSPHPLWQPGTPTAPPARAIARPNSSPCSTVQPRRFTPCCLPAPARLQPLRWWEQLKQHLRPPGEASAV